MGPNLITGPAFNFGYAGASFGQSAGFFNVRPDDVAKSIDDHPLDVACHEPQRVVFSGDLGIGLNSANRLTVGGNAGFSGSVGIGTIDTPLARLEVRGPDTSGSTAAFTVFGSGGLPGFTVYDDRTAFIGTFDGSSTQHLCVSPGGRFAFCSSAAEYVATIDAGAGFPTTADLVIMAPAVSNPYDDTHSPFTVQKAATPCDANLLGFIVNPELGAEGVKVNDHYLPLAMYGYFPAKVTMETGVIKRGDAITSSSKAGYGMKATGACKVIGYARFKMPSARG